MYSGYLSLFLIIGFAILLVLLAGLIFSIIVFYTKSKVHEVIAWICGGLWLLLDQCIAYSGKFETEGIPNYFFYPILLLFFLLLQYRSNSAEGNNLKILYIAKTVLVVVFLGDLNSQIFTMLLQNDIVSYDQPAVRIIIPAVGVVISISVMAYITFLYLERIKASIQKNEIFRSAIIFVAASYFFGNVLGNLFFFIQYYKRLSDVSGFIFFRPQQIAIQLAYMLVETLVAATIAAYIYKSKQEAITQASIKE